MLRLSERMKEYEQCSSLSLPRNMPIIMRLDGRAFHSFTKQFKKPFDDDLAKMMNKVAGSICQEMQNARIAYLQSDEISILIYNSIESDVWFGNNVQKMTSISASIAAFTASQWISQEDKYSALNIAFDSRVFSIPEKDVVNYFIWRQRDWERNSLHMVCKTHYSQADLQGVSSAGMHELLHKKDINWNNLEPRWKRGRCIIKVDTPDMPHKCKWGVDDMIPIFSEDRDYIQKILDNANIEKA